MFRSSEIWILLIPLILIVAYVYFNGLVVREAGFGRVAIGDHEFKVEIVDTILGRQRGLSGRDKLDEGTGMLFLFGGEAPRRFWMKDMLISIDIIWISGNEVVGFDKNVLPEPGVRTEDLIVYESPVPVGTVLEVHAGTVDRLGIKVGDSVSVSL